MADILIEHGTVITLNGQRRIIEDGAVAIRGDRIVAVDSHASKRILRPNSFQSVIRTSALSWC